MRLGQHLSSILRVRGFSGRLDERLAELPGGHGPLGHWQAWRKDPIEVLGRAVGLGDCTVVRLAYEPLLVFNHPQAFEEVLVSKAEGFDRAPVSGAIVSPHIGDNMLTTNGEVWQRHRSMAQPSFHPLLVDQAIGEFAVEAAEILDEWKRFAASGGALDLARESMCVTARISVRFFLGLALSQKDAETLVDGIVRTQRWLFRSMSALLPERMPAEVRVALEFMDELVARALRVPADASASPSYLERLRQDKSFAEREVRDQAIMMLVAAPENPSNTFAWTAWLLAKHDDWRERLYAEIVRHVGLEPPSVEALEHMPELDRVCKEVLRLYPGGWLVDRQAKSDQEVLGKPVPKGAIVGVSPFFLHRHERYWPEPLRFDPDRFLPDREQARPRFAWLPFGAGPRVCIGSRLALLEVKLLTVLFLQRYRFLAESDRAPTVEGLFALRARDGVRGRLEPRS